MVLCIICIHRSFHILSCRCRFKKFEKNHENDVMVNTKKCIWISNFLTYFQTLFENHNKKVSLLKYRVSQHVWDRLNAIFWSSEVFQQRLRILRKNVFCSIKLLFQPFLWTAKKPMEFLGNFFPKILCSNLFSKLFEIGEKWL